MLNPKIFLFIPTSATDSATVNPNGIRNLLANCLSTFFVKGLPFFRVSRNLSADCTILDGWVFDNFIIAYELVAKALRSFGTCLLVANNLCIKSN